jgi:hypothetical protein
VSDDSGRRDRSRPSGDYGMIAQFEMTTGRRAASERLTNVGSLLERGPTARIRTKNAFLGNAQAVTTTADIYIICGEFGAVRAAEVAALPTLIEDETVALGFQIGWRVIEIQGTCDRRRDSRIGQSTRFTNRRTIHRRPGSCQPNHVSGKPGRRSTGGDSPARPSRRKSRVASRDVRMTAFGVRGLIRHLRVGLYFLAEPHPRLGTVAVDL